MKRKVNIIKNILLIYIIFSILCLAILPLFHKSVEYKEDLPFQSVNMEGQERILGIDDNVDALLWRLCLIEASRERVILATFDFRDDKSGQDIMASLLNAADRGVKVQILIDGINGRLRLSKSKNFQELIAHENVEAKLYNPVNLS